MRQSPRVSPTCSDQSASRRHAERPAIHRRRSQWRQGLSERMHTITNQVAEGLTTLDVTPARDEIERRIAGVAPGRLCRPVLALEIDGAYVPSRPEARVTIQEAREKAVEGGYHIYGSDGMDTYYEGVNSESSHGRAQIMRPRLWCPQKNGVEDAAAAA
jgi:hypothetical protein